MKGVNSEQLRLEIINTASAVVRARGGVDMAQTFGRGNSKLSKQWQSQEEERLTGVLAELGISREVIEELWKEQTFAGNVEELVRRKLTGATE